MAEHILKDKFYLSNDAIVFSQNGELLNGQHRLNACVLADKPILVNVMRNADEDIFPIIDNGLPRTIAFRCGLPSSRVSSMIARAIDGGQHITGLVDGFKLISAYKKYESEINFMNENFKSHRVGVSASVRAALLNAYIWDGSKRNQLFSRLAHCLNFPQEAVTDGERMMGQLAHRMASLPDIDRKRKGRTAVETRIYKTSEAHIIKAMSNIYSQNVVTRHKYIFPLLEP